MTKKYLIWVVVALILVGGIYLFSQPAPKETGLDEPAATEEETGAPIAKPAISKDSARLVLAIKDEAVNLESVQSLLFNIKGISLLKQGEGWVTISNTPQTFDLIQLKKEGRFILLADTRIMRGEYSQIRLALGTVVVVKGGVANDVKLPSNELKVLTNLSVSGGTTAAVTIDILADKSLHQTGSGKYIFAPVLKLKSYENVESVQILGKKVDLFGGKPKVDVEVGMDENGDLKVGSKIDPGAKLEIGKNAIIVVLGIDIKDFKISAETAADNAVFSNHIGRAISVRAEKRLDDNLPIWVVTGFNGLKRVVVKVDGTSGTIISAE